MEGPDSGGEESAPNASHRVHFQPLRDLRFVADQAHEARLQGGRQRFRERRQQYAALRMGAGEVHCPMEGHDRLAGAGRPGNARGAVVPPLDHLPLGRMEEDRPLLPRVFQRAGERLHVPHHPEATLGVRMREGIGARRGGGRVCRRAAGRDLQRSASAASAGR